MTQRAARAAAAILVALASGCSSGSKAPAPAARKGSEIREAMRLVGSERRPARSPQDPRGTIRFSVPLGARHAVLRAAAWRTGWRSTFTVRDHATSCRARVLRGEGMSAETSLTVPIVPGEGDASWSRTSLPLSGAESIELNCPDLPPDAAAWFAVPTWSGLAPAAARNVVMVSLDTLRADAVGESGQALPTTPQLDELSRRGTSWSRASSAAPWTLPSHVSVMTGRFPSWHGRVDVRTLDRDLPEIPTLAGILGRAGWETAAFTGMGSISWVLGSTRDFQLVVEHAATAKADAKECDASAAAAVAWLREGRAREGAPFLLFWHAYEPHWPYHDERFLGLASHLPPGIAEDARSDWLRYLGDVAAADAALGRLLAALDELGLAATTDVYVFSDHGEEFGEHSDGRREEATRHGHGLWETLLHVPLVAATPAIAPGQRNEMVSLVDLFPTVLASLGVPAPPNQGIDLAMRRGRRAVAAEALYTPYVVHQERAWHEAGGLKYVTWLASPPGERLHDLERDPLELRDVGALRPDDMQRLREDAAGFWRDAPAGGAAGQAGQQALPDEVLESLRSLGYVR